MFRISIPNTDPNTGTQLKWEKCFIELVVHILKKDVP